MTINEILVLKQAVRERVNELRGLRTQVATRERFFGLREETKAIEPQYDVKTVDRKITELEMFLFKADAAIKQANAVTQVNVEANVEKLLEPLQ